MKLDHGGFAVGYASCLFAWQSRHYSTSLSLAVRSVSQSTEEYKKF